MNVTRSWLVNQACSSVLSNVGQSLLPTIWATCLFKPDSNCECHHNVLLYTCRIRDDEHEPTFLNDILWACHSRQCQGKSLILPVIAICFLTSSQAWTESTRASTDSLTEGQQYRRILEQQCNYRRRFASPSPEDGQCTAGGGSRSLH